MSVITKYMEKNIINSLFILLLVGMSGCERKEKTPQLLVLNDPKWKEVVQQSPQKVPFPDMLNVWDLRTIGNSLLLKSEGTDHLFYAVNPATMQIQWKAGKVGQGPGEFTKYPTIMKQSNKEMNNILGVYDRQLCTFYTVKDGSPNLKTQKESVGGYGLYQYMYPLNDSLFCVSYTDRKETRVDLANLYNYHVYDSIAKEENYNQYGINREECAIAVYENKLVTAKMRYDQIEIYDIDIKQHKFIPRVIVNHNNASADDASNNKTHYYYIEDINCDANYIYLLNQFPLKDKKYTCVDIYGWDGNAIRRIELDVHVTKATLLNNTLYMRSMEDDDNVYVLKLGNSNKF